ncbi:peroxin [Puccinia graminis f. sp. tritici]|uniref:Peroxin n=1 Tax=Puccinia graminis f. sp. tritici TaxID=56615 RepID=A0A5B0P9D0_PUCGR|nr:peroxin [Puccinia graminis f. sp. tritici]KAA1131918.1 peroxin [Puccinia graminis f. sp. tritici]
MGNTTSSSSEIINPLDPTLTKRAPSDELPTSKPTTAPFAQDLAELLVPPNRVDALASRNLEDFVLASDLLEIFDLVWKKVELKVDGTQFKSVYFHVH